VLEFDEPDTVPSLAADPVPEPLVPFALQE
jgi:hypothetical protein